MTFSEKQLEDDFYNNLLEQNFKPLFDRGFDFYDPETKHDIFFVDRQVSLPPYGIADILCTKVDLHETPVGLDGVVYIDLIELKVEPIKSKHFDQVLRYKKAIERYSHTKFRLDESKYCFEVHVCPILIGCGFDSGHYIFNKLDFNKEVYLYTYDSSPISGITFKHHSGGWYKEESEDNISTMDDSLMYEECVNYFHSEIEKYHNSKTNGNGEKIH